MRMGLLLAVVTAPLAGCGAGIDAPPLTPQPFERLPIDLPAATSEVDSPPDAAVAARLAAFARTADGGDAGFETARAIAARRIDNAARAAPGSEPWTVAQQALSALEAARGPVRDAADGIEALRQEPASAGTGNRAAVETAAAHVEALDTREADALAVLSARLR